MVKTRSATPGNPQIVFDAALKAATRAANKLIKLRTKEGLPVPAQDLVELILFSSAKIGFESGFRTGVKQLGAAVIEADREYAFFKIK